MEKKATPDGCITIEQAKELIKNKRHLYQAMQRNFYYMPALRSSLVTQKYMEGVRDKSIWCPLYGDLKPKPCPDPPSKEYLLQEVHRLASEKKYNLGISSKKVPDKAWLLQVLAILNPFHKVFSKDYIPPVRPIAKENIPIDNNDSFFSNLAGHLQGVHFRKRL